MVASKKLWIIEDMLELQTVYRAIFDDNQYELTFFTSFNEFACNYQDKVEVDLIIADIMLEDGHFFKLLNDTDLTLSTPYLVISASDDLPGMRVAFDAGAIDYILKPFNYNEILAKVEKHLQVIEERNIQTSKSLAALNLDLTAFTNKEVKIIESFNMKEDKTLHRNDIVNIIWKNISIHPNTLDVHIYNLRKKLKQFDHGIKAIGNGLFKFTSYELVSHQQVETTNV